MSDEQNVAVIRAGYAAFSRGDLDGLLQLLDPQITWTTPGPPELPTAGTRRGRTAVAQFFGTLLDLIDPLQFEPDEFIAAGDRVVVLGRAAWRVKGTGNTLDSRWVHVLTVRGGKVSSFEEFSDTAALLAELQGSRAQL